MDFLRDRLSCHKIFDFPSGGCMIWLPDKSSNRLVTAGVQPVIPRLCIRICFQSVTVIDHIPRAVHSDISKLITIIPFFYLIIPVRKAVIIQHILYFLICETKVFIKLYVCHRQNFNIVQSCKNTFFWNAHTPGQYRKFQTVICFQGILKHISDEYDHLIIIASLKSFCQWHIVLIDQQNHFASMMFFKKLRHNFQAAA